MNDPFQLVTNCSFKGKDYLVQMCVLNSKKLELIITDKIMAEDWQCEYDASYIEALTHKTGNFKQFEVFIMMLKSGLLKTSDCITLDLLTFEDLEQLRCKKIVNSHSSSRSSQSMNLNKRYLILTYSVEFDRIHYPLPLDYCGPPDPTVLQNNIRKLESEIERLKHKSSLQTQVDVGDVKKFQEKLEKHLHSNEQNLDKMIQSLVEDNQFLTSEVQRLNKIISKRSNPVRNNQAALNSLKKLEEQVVYEKTQNKQLIMKLKNENRQLKQQIEDLKKKEKCLNLKLKEANKCIQQRNCSKFLRNSLSPEINVEQKKISANKLPCRPVTVWNNSPVTKPQRHRSIRNSRNRYLTSSSSESEMNEIPRGRSREKKTFTRPSICFKRRESLRKSSNERSRHSSEDDKRNIKTQRSRLSATSPEGKAGSTNVQQTAQFRKSSRGSSLSSRDSSKHSKVSRFSARGSGDRLSIKKKDPAGLLDEKEDIKFTMSDLEARIHSLQKLLSEGLHF